MCAKGGIKTRIIHNTDKREEPKRIFPDSLISFLPRHVTLALESCGGKGCIEEIRLRAGRYSSCVRGGENITLDLLLDSVGLSDILRSMCGGSLYAYSDTINQGYISLDGGIRVGIGGRATSEGERIVGIYDVSLLCIRLPHKTGRVGFEICKLLDSMDNHYGVLIYSPPGVGKTTLLRGVAAIAASGERRRRVVVIDTRGELSFELDSKSLCLDVLSGYPRRLGIEIATRTLNAELMICDEIGDIDEAMALVSSHNCGVPLVASAHAGSVEQLLARTGIRLLHEAKIFGAYVGIKRDGAGGFNLSVTYHKEALCI